METTIKKICILQNGLAKGGTDTFVVNLCRGLAHYKCNITVVNPSETYESKVREPDVLATGAKIIHTSPLYNGFRSKLRHLKMLYYILKKGRYDVFQTNIDLFNGPNLFVAWLAGIPVRCCHSHNGMQQRTVTQGMTLTIKIYQWLMRWMCWHFANRHSGCSDIANNFLYKGHNWDIDSYPTIINNGIDIDHFTRHIDIKSKKKELGLTKKYHILTVGRIIPQKNPLFIAETISELCLVNKDVDFVWVSDGPLRVECEKVFRINGVLDRVHFLGFRDDIAEIMKCIDLFYMPSIFEGLPLVLIEAQASGLPCLVSDSITQQANCGLIHYLSLSVGQDVWVNTMNQIMRNEIKLKIDHNKLYLFSIKRMVEQMQQVFET